MLRGRERDFDANLPIECLKGCGSKVGFSGFSLTPPAAWGRSLLHGLGLVRHHNEADLFAGVFDVQRNTKYLVVRRSPSLSDFDKLFAVNVRAPFFLVQQLLPILHEGSSIVLLSSLGARAAVGTLSAYSATKGAVDTLVRHFASSLGARGVRVNAVAPGVVETDMSNFTKTEAGRNFALGMQALKRLAQPADIGGVVAFLASEEARWITGDTIHADGGSKL